MSTMDATEVAAKSLPWLSFQTFWSFLGELASKPLPPKLDRSMMTSKSGTDQANLIGAMQLFGLIDDENRVQSALGEFVVADEERRKAMLGEWVRGQYGPALRVSAENGTAQNLNDVFRDEMGMASPDTRRKSITFFQHAAQHAGIALSPNFPKTRTGSGAPGTPRLKRNGGKRKPKDNGGGDEPQQQTPPTKGHSHTVTLASGGTVTLAYDVNLFESSTEDEEFVLGLVRKLRKYPTVDVEAEEKVGSAS
jgi:hypothetical protein